MKKKIAMFFCFALIFTMLIPNTVAVAFEQKSEDVKIENNMLAIENELNANQTDVVYEINRMIDYYKNMLIGLTENSEIAKINNLISTLENLREEYQIYKSDVSTCKYHAIYSPAVATVIAYFSNKGYILAAELLTHARENTVLDSNYSPVNGFLVKQSPVVQSIANGIRIHGDGEFTNTGNVVNRDLYYAIHFFKFKKYNGNSRTVYITDRYDYEEGDYSSVAGVAIDTMYKAQEAGVITPYQVKITVTL